MMLTIKRITDALGISRARVEQWISRGHFATSEETTAGRKREWSFRDAVRLALMNRLLAQAVDAETAGRLTQLDIHPAGESVTFFVAWSGWDEVLHREIVDAASLGDFLTASEIEFAIVVNVDTLAREVREALGMGSAGTVAG